MLNNVIFWISYLGGIFYSLLSGSAEASGGALIEGAGEAVQFCIRICGAICFWCAVTELMERSGVSAHLERLLRPILRLLFPKSSADAEGLSALSQNLSANLLGLGNAATPAGVRAVKRMSALGAETELGRLVVMNTASLQLLPTSIAALRASLGAAAPFDILVAVWLSSLISLICGLLAAELFRAILP